MTNYTKLRELLAAAQDALYIEERPNSDGTVYIDDGLSNGIFPIVCEVPQAQLIATLHNSAEELIEKAEKYDVLLNRFSHLIRTIDAAIKAGDWVIDGACDPDVERLRRLLK